MLTSPSSRLRKGFTLIELMIVIVIIGILMAISIPAYQKIRESAHEKTLVSDLRSVYTAEHAYFGDNPSAPSITLKSLADNHYCGMPADKYGVSFNDAAVIKPDQGLAIKVNESYVFFPEVNGKTRGDKGVAAPDGYADLTK